LVSAEQNHLSRLREQDDGCDSHGENMNVDENLEQNGHWMHRAAMQMQELESKSKMRRHDDEKRVPSEKFQFHHPKTADCAFLCCYAKRFPRLDAQQHLLSLVDLAFWGLDKCTDRQYLNPHNVCCKS
jgi:hypothetical protein